MSEVPPWVSHCANLADPTEGAAVIAVSDEFFAPAKRILAPAEPRYLPDRFEEHGKWMDGWESRRRRDAGHDYCVIRICRGLVRGVDIDTRHFTGNFPEAAALEGCHVDTDPDADSPWVELLPRTALGPDRHHYFEVNTPGPWSHLRLNIFPDGGVARLRVYGEPAARNRRDPAWVDLAASVNGGRALYCNDMHFGNVENMIAPGEPRSMADGWETRRRRGDGNDFAILRLGSAGRVRRIEVDTAFFRGNCPACCALRAARLDTAEADPEASAEWPLLLPPSALGPDQLHVFQRELRDHEPVSHVRLDIFPDGGVARLRLFGEVQD